MGTVCRSTEAPDTAAAGTVRCPERAVTTARSPVTSMAISCGALHNYWTVDLVRYGAAREMIRPRLCDTPHAYSSAVSSDTGCRWEGSRALQHGTHLERGCLVRERGSGSGGSGGAVSDGGGGGGGSRRGGGRLGGSLGAAGDTWKGFRWSGAGAPGQQRAGCRTVSMDPAGPFACPTHVAAVAMCP